MRRLRKHDELAEARLVPENLRPAPIDDLNLPIRDRVRIWEEWMGEREAWVAERQRYADEFGWPTGVVAMGAEEWATHPVPDAPWDPDAI